MLNDEVSGSNFRIEDGVEQKKKVIQDVVCSVHQRNFDAR